MAKAIRYTGDNAMAICEWTIGRELKPFGLAGGFWLKQVTISDELIGHQLAAPARNGEVYLDPGDYWVRENDGGFVRLSPEQMSREHPLLMAALGG